MRHPGLFWGAAIAGLVAVDVWTHVNATDGDTLSEQVRPLFRTHTPAGRVALIAAWAALTAWVLPHWCRHTAALPDPRPRRLVAAAAGPGTTHTSKEPSPWR